MYRKYPISDHYADSWNAPPTGWPLAYRCILDLDLPQNSHLKQLFEHMIAETAIILCLTTAVASSSCSRQKLCTKKQPDNGPDWPPKRRDLAAHIICISLNFLHNSLRETQQETLASIKFGELVIRIHWQILNLAITSTSAQSDMYETILPGFKFGDFPQNRQFAKLQTSPKFPAIWYYTFSQQPGYTNFFKYSQFKGYHWGRKRILPSSP